MELFIYLVSKYGYLGLFIVNALSSASIFLPIPGYLAVLVVSAELNPIGVALSAGLGSSVGELTGYFLGLGGKKLINDRSKRSGKPNLELEAARRIFARYGAFAIFAFAATPLPFDLIGIACGTFGFDMRLFFLATFFGKTIKYLLLAYTGRGLFGVFQSFLEGRLNLSSLILVFLLVVLMVIPLVYWNILVSKLKREQPQEVKTEGSPEEAIAEDNALRRSISKNRISS